MEIKTIFENDEMVVKAVWYMDKFLYTKTYWIDENGFCDKSITVYADKTVETNTEKKIFL